MPNEAVFVAPESENKNKYEIESSKVIRSNDLDSEWVLPFRWPGIQVVKSICCTSSLP